MNEAFAAFEEKAHEMRDEGILSAAPLKTAMDFAGQFAALRLLCDELNNIRGPPAFTAFRSATTRP